MQPTILAGRYVVEEIANQSSGNRTFLATGPRGASYGCIQKSPSHWVWFNMRSGRAINSVPDDLARTHPSVVVNALEAL